jgi:hypothetical protein
MLTATYKCQQNKCYPRKHLNSGKRDGKKKKKLIENKYINRMRKKRGGGGVIPSHERL